MTFTLRSKPALFSTAKTHWPLMLHALLSLCFGAAIYLLYREHPAIFIPEWLFNFRTHLQPDHVKPTMLRQSLPSFFHMYALMLASQALSIKPAHIRRNYFRELFTPAAVICFVIGFGLEIVQHPDLKSSLTQMSLAYSDSVSLLSGAANYGAQGTYDLNDMLAIGAAGLLATAHVHWLSKKINGPNQKKTSFIKQPVLTGDN